MDNSHPEIAPGDGQAVTLPFPREQEASAAADSSVAPAGQLADDGNGQLHDEHGDDNSPHDYGFHEQPLLLSVTQVAALCQVAPRTVWRWDGTGKLPQPIRIGGTTRWRRADIEDWIEAGCPQQTKEN